ncbi:hypothetical protein AALB16_01595 [Lachnospiraceae bacterium 62-35]
MDKLMAEENTYQLDCEKETEPKLQLQAYLKKRGNLSVLVCICGKGSCGIYGEIVDFCRKETEKFSGVRDLVLKVKGLCSELSTPMGERVLSCYESMERKNYMAVYDKQQEGSKDSLLKEGGWVLYPGIHGAREILAVLVMREVKGNLWGVIRGRLTGNRYMAFHSTLEFMQLLDKIEI